MGFALAVNLAVADVAIKVAGIPFPWWEWLLVLLTIGSWPSLRFCSEVRRDPENSKKIWDALTLLITGNSTKAALAVVPTLYSFIYLLDKSRSFLPTISELYFIASLITSVVTLIFQQSEVDITYALVNNVAESGRPAERSC